MTENIKNQFYGQLILKFNNLLISIILFKKYLFIFLYLMNLFKTKKNKAKK